MRTPPRVVKIVSPVGVGSSQGKIEATDTEAIVQFLSGSGNISFFKIDASGITIQITGETWMTGNANGCTFLKPVQSLTGVVTFRWPQIVEGADLPITSNVLAPTSGFHAVDSANAINTITPSGWTPAGGELLYLLPLQAFTWTTSGNIGKAGTAVVGKLLVFMYRSSGNKWWPSYT